MPFCFFSVIAFGQKIERFEHLNTTYGLSENNIMSIFCDSKGYLWFGTMDRLNRYDGNSFRVYKVDKHKKNSLTHNRVKKIWRMKEALSGFVHMMIMSIILFLPQRNSLLFLVMLLTQRKKTVLSVVLLN